MTWDATLAFGLGLLIGSFINVVIYRLPHMVMADPPHAATHNLCWPASHCPHCQTALRVWHNLPLISFVWLRGRCSFCQQRISWQYPLVEFATACIWLFCSQYWGANATGLCWAGFGTVLLALAVIDWQTTLLPDALTQALVWGGILASAQAWLAIDLHQSVWGATLGYVSLWVIATLFERITGKQGMGAGDYKFLAGLGAWLGPWALLPVLLLASLSGAAVGLALAYTHRLREGGYVPFGPFLAAAGAAVAVMGMETVARWMGWAFIA